MAIVLAVEEQTALDAKLDRIGEPSVPGRGRDEPDPVLPSGALAPLPNAWLGNLKNKNLVEEFGGDAGFWELFADGVENMQVKEGHILVKFKE